MKTYKIRNSKDIKLPEIVACIGNFDGVHKGHKALINKVIEIANKKNLIPALITFYPSPLDILEPNTKHLTTLTQRKKIFKELGIEILIIIEFDENTMRTDHQKFLEKYLYGLNIDTLICGYDFTYGYKSLGNIKTLKKASNDHFNLIIIDQISYRGKKISSTRIRKALAEEKFEYANKLLGHKYNE